MALRPTDFLTRYDFRRRAVARLESGVRLDRGCSLKPPLGPRRPLSTPAARLSRVRIGSALPRESRGFADFDGIRQGVSAAAAQYCLSPLRLPISPSGPSTSVYLGSPAHGEVRS